MQFTYQGINLRETNNQDLVDYVLQTEYASENSKFINKWTREQHLEVIHDKNKMHLTAELINSNERIGYVILMKNQYRSIEFRRIVVSRKGQGYGRTLIQLIKKIAFEHLKAHRLWLDVIEFNTRAQQLYRSEGFIQEGILRDAYQALDGKFHNLFILSILAYDYVPSK
ncbi:MAG: GNAT family N-acetyltransferase [Candidatus Kariarchaeaceae archaeon]|jgi:RimJ/RimL family protein N-acetyltransferase